MFIVRFLGWIVAAIGGGLIATWAHLGIAGAVALDFGLVILLEGIIVGGPIAIAVGIKGIIPAAVGAYVLPMILPTPTTTATVFSAIVTAAAGAGVGWYLIRGRRYATRPAGDGGDWAYRRITSAVFLAASATTELTVAGWALTMDHLEASHIAGALAPGLLLLIALNLQTPSRRDGSRAVESGRTMIPLPAVLTPTRDQTAQTVLAGGVH